MYIEIADGLSIRIDEIEAIGYGNNQLTSKVYTHHNVYDSTFPYSVLLQLLQREKIEKESIDKQAFNIMKEMGNWAG